MFPKPSWKRMGHVIVVVITLSLASLLLLVVVNMMGLQQEQSIDSSSSSSLSIIPRVDDSPTKQSIRKLMNDATKKKKEGFVYETMATIVPDPFHTPIEESTRQSITETYGKWHFWDGDAAIRPQGDYCGEYPNRDIPGNDFPDNAWQTDAVYVNHLINDAEELLERTIEAIYEEYGLGKSQNTDLGKLLADRMKMTHVHKIDLSDPTVQIPSEASNEGGWTTSRSFDGLVLRLLHAIMTNDTFTVVLGGHSAAAGHGNHFHQNYLMQFHKVMAPVFARLGVKLITRNVRGICVCVYCCCSC